MNADVVSVSECVGVMVNADEMCSCWTWTERYLQASNSTSEIILAVLAFDSCEKVRVQVAGNIHTPALILEKLSHDRSTEVRLSVAENIHTPARTLERLALDISDDVRYGIAENHNIPLRILKTLTEDENPYVVHRAERTIKNLEKEQVIAERSLAA